MTKKAIIFLAVFAAACAPSPSTTSTTTAPAVASATITVSESTATVVISPTLEIVENVEQATTTPEEEGRIVIDMSGAVLEREINPLCKDQFPVSIENGSVTVCFTFDNWVFGPVDLGNGYEMIAGAEVWYEQDGKQIAVLLPLATANREANEMQINGTQIMDFKEIWYLGREGSWEVNTKLKAGDTLWITFDMPTDNLRENSTQGFGFEDAQYTREQLEEALRTGDFSILGNLLWPVIDIVGRD